MKNKISMAQIRYWFDCIMSKGPIAMSCLLFAVTAIVVCILGLFAYLVAEDGGIGYQLWISLLHTIDPGTLAGNTTDNIPYLFMMFFATLFGLFFTSILIGVIATGVENKLNTLRKGTSVIQERGHTVIVGFNNNIFDLLREIIEANLNKKKSCVVILGDLPKKEMEDIISSHIPNTETTRIVCRSGSLYESYAFERCAVEFSRSVIINIHDDAESIKTLLAVSSYLKEKKPMNSEVHIVATIHDKQYVEAANIAGEGFAQIIYAKDTISKIIASTCYQHGLSQVFSELFNFSEHEFYFESISELEGKTFRDSLFCFPNAVVAGVYSKEQVLLNPPMDTLIHKNDLMILLEKDDGAYRISTPNAIDTKLISSSSISTPHANSQLVVLGSNDKLPVILHEYNKYMDSCTNVIVVDSDFDESIVPFYENLNITICSEPITRTLLYGFLMKGANNFLLLNDDSLDPESSDSQTLLHLILLRDIADKAGIKISITTEMKNTDNQRLASRARVDDFVIGSNFTSLLMAQISENHRISPLINEILDERGSEFHMKPAYHYVTLGEPVDSYVLTESAAQKGEIFVGYRLMGPAAQNVVISPNKYETIVFGQDDQVVVLSQN